MSVKHPSRILEIKGLSKFACTFFRVPPTAFEYTVRTRTRAALHKAEQPLQGVELQQKNKTKMNNLINLIRQTPKIKSTYKALERLYSSRSVHFRKLY